MCWHIKTHSSVSCGARNRETLGMEQTSVYFTVKIHFHASVAQTSLSRNTQNFLCKFSRGGAPPIPNLSWIYQAIPEICTFKVRLIFFVFLFFFFFFSQHFLNRYNSCVLCWIVLKLGPLLQHIKAYLWFNFCNNWINKHWVFNNFLNFQVWSFVAPTG